ncbi:MAG TPA: trypsin-like peptidase domain-containing protein [Methylomirabilota bacterium]|nr:trypsin-like peptidase domain-containing protein [Methylomirabilota bacterium]
MLFLVVLALLTAVTPAPVDAAATVQEVLLRAKPAVALIVAEVTSEIRLRCAGGDGIATPPPFRETGTGWFVNPSGWLITNAHVVSAAHRPPEWLEAQQVQKAGRPGCRVVDVKLQPSISVILSNGFRLAATIVKFSPPIVGEAMSGQDLALLKVEAADMPSLALGDSDAVRIGDRVHILGFPGVVLSSELLHAFATVESSVTNGGVSGFRRDRVGQPVVQTDAPAALGNSGGPAIDHSGKVVGVLTFATLSGEQGTFVQGFNFIIPSRTVREFLHDTGVALDEPSLFNRAWHLALTDFFAGNHHRAEAAFTEANRLLPEVPDIMRLTRENAEKIKNPPPRPFPWIVAASVTAGLSLAVLGGLASLRWKRSRFRITPAEVARLFETLSDPPVILDVRDPEAYERSPIRIPNSLYVPPAVLASGRTDLRFDYRRTVIAYCT